MLRTMIPQDAIRTASSLFAALLLAVPTLAQVAPPDPSTASEALAEAKKKETEEGDQEAEGDEEEVEWLVDQEGNQYYIDKIRKKKGRYRRVGENKVRTQWGPTIEILDEDEDYFYFKVLKVERITPPEEPGPTPEDIELILTSYETDIDETDRLAFAAFDEGLPSTGQWRNGFELVDMNGDGHVDLVHGSPRKPRGPPAVFLGDGAGHWKSWPGFRLPRFGYDYGDVAVADLNDDGHLDLAFAMHLRGVVALVGDGEGTFELYNEGLDYKGSGEGSTGLSFTSRALVALDWNADGLPDLAALGEGPHLVRAPKTGGLKGRQARGVTLYINQGDGSWERHADTDPQALFGDSLTTGDVNDDGRPDLVTASHVQGLKGILYLNDGEARAWEQRELEILRPGAYIHSATVADLDGDGDTDLVVGYLSRELETWRTGLDLYLDEGAEGWSRVALMAKEGVERIRSVTHGDVDGDGHLDIAGVTEGAEVVLFLGNGDGEFVRETGTELTGPEGENCRGYHVGLADADGDGRDEVFATFAGEQAGIIELRQCPDGGSIQAWDARPKEASGPEETTEGDAAEASP